jgi:hypothetical protein
MQSESDGGRFLLTNATHKHLQQSNCFRRNIHIIPSSHRMHIPICIDATSLSVAVHGNTST